MKAKAKKPRREYTRRSKKEIAKLLAAYAKVKRGGKSKWLEEHKLTSGHIHNWKQMEL